MPHSPHPNPQGPNSGPATHAANQEKPNKAHIMFVLNILPKATCLVNTRGDFKHRFQKLDFESPFFLSYCLSQISLSITPWEGGSISQHDAVPSRGVPRGQC